MRFEYILHQLPVVIWISIIFGFVVAFDFEHSIYPNIDFKFLFIFLRIRNEIMWWFRLGYQVITSVCSVTVLTVFTLYWSFTANEIALEMRFSWPMANGHVPCPGEGEMTQYCCQFILDPGRFRENHRKIPSTAGSITNMNLPIYLKKKHQNFSHPSRLRRKLEKPKKLEQRQSFGGVDTGMNAWRKIKYQNGTINQQLCFSWQAWHVVSCLIVKPIVCINCRLYNHISPHHICNWCVTLNVNRWSVRVRAPWCALCACTGCMLYRERVEWFEKYVLVGTLEEINMHFCIVSLIFIIRCTRHDQREKPHRLYPYAMHVVAGSWLLAGRIKSGNGNDATIMWPTWLLHMK